MPAQSVPTAPSPRSTPEPKKQVSATASRSPSPGPLVANETPTVPPDVWTQKMLHVWKVENPILVTNPILSI